MYIYVYVNDDVDPALLNSFFPLCMLDTCMYLCLWVCMHKKECAYTLLAFQHFHEFNKMNLFLGFNSKYHHSKWYVHETDDVDCETSPGLMDTAFIVDEKNSNMQDAIHYVHAIISPLDNGLDHCRMRHSEIWTPMPRAT